MKPRHFIFIGLLLFILGSCRENPAKSTSTSDTTAIDTTINKAEQTTKEQDTTSNRKVNYTQKGTTKNVGETRTNKGIGPIERIDLPAKIDSDLAAKGKDLYNNNCASCHRIHESTTGPALGSVLDRRTPEFVMNMILNTDEMIEKEPVVMALKGEYESDMVQVNIDEDEARAIVEYLRQYQ